MCEVETTKQAKQLTKQLISKAPQGILWLINRTNNSNRIQYKDIIVLLQEDINVIKKDLEVLRSAPLKTAKLDFKIGLEQHLQAVQSSRQDSDGTTNDWKETLKGASEKANDAYSLVTEADDRIECFWIICSCAIATADSPQAACIKIRIWIDELLNNNETNRKALKDLKDCTKHGDNRTMTLETKDLLSSLFMRLRGALVTLLYLYEENIDTFGKQERKELIQVLKKHKYLPKATSLICKWKHIEVNHYNTFTKTLVYCTIVIPLLGGMYSAVTSAATLGKVNPPMPASSTSTMETFNERVVIGTSKSCNTILETGHFLNAILHKHDYKLQSNMIKWLPTTRKKEEQEANKYKYGMLVLLFTFVVTIVYLVNPVFAPEPPPVQDNSFFKLWKYALNDYILDL